MGYQRTVGRRGAVVGCCDTERRRIKRMVGGGDGSRRTCDFEGDISNGRGGI